LPVADLVAAKLSNAAALGIPFDIALFGNSRVVSVGRYHLSLSPDVRFFNFAVGGTSFLQSVRSLEYLAENGVAPGTAVISIDNAELQFVGLQYWPHPFFDGKQFLADLSTLLHAEYGTLHQRVKDAVKLVEYQIGSSWHQLSLSWNFDTFVRRGSHQFGIRDSQTLRNSSNLSDGSRTQVLPDHQPDFRQFRPETSAPRAWNRFVLLGLRRLARIAELHGTRVVIFESPLAPELAVRYSAGQSQAAQETRRWMAKGCAAGGLECWPAPLLPVTSDLPWPDCCHAPAAQLGQYILGLLEHPQPPN